MQQQQQQPAARGGAPAPTPAPVGAADGGGALPWRVQLRFAVQPVHSVPSATLLDVDKAGQVRVRVVPVLGEPLFLAADANP